MIDDDDLDVLCIVVVDVERVGADVACLIYSWSETSDADVVGPLLRRDRCKWYSMSIIDWIA
jgi:hypothetical protein